ncbi:MAG: DNA-3-methyladenine glycosylase I [Pseudomonadota bacterium]
MGEFAAIRERAEARKGGAEALQLLMPRMLSERRFRALGNDRVLATMCRVINQAGFNWTVIANKWPEFEEAFYGFSLARLTTLSPEEWEAYRHDRRIVRHWPKIQALRDNVFFVMEHAAEHGSFAKFMATYPPSAQVELLAYLKKHGYRLGGNTGQWFLRYLGRDGFVLTRDVVTVIRSLGHTIAEEPSSKRDLATVQSVFNAWHEESGLPYSHLSRIAACSVGSNIEATHLQAEIAKFEKSQAKSRGGSS